MSNIKQFFDKDGNDIFPVTHASAVFDDKGNNVADLIKEAKLSGVNVNDFGAVGDGKTDDTQAIQTAIEYAITNNIYEVSFGVGTYACNLNIPSRITLRGLSASDITSNAPYTTKLIPYDGNFPVISIKGDTQPEYITISSMLIKGTSATGNKYYGVAGIYIEGAKHIFIEKVTVCYFDKNVHITNNDNQYTYFIYINDSVLKQAMVNNLYVKGTSNSWMSAMYINNTYISNSTNNNNKVGSNIYTRAQLYMNNVWVDGNGVHNTVIDASLGGYSMIHGHNVSFDSTSTSAPILCIYKEAYMKKVSCFLDGNIAVDGYIDFQHVDESTIETFSSSTVYNTLFNPIATHPIVSDQLKFMDRDLVYSDTANITYAGGKLIFEVPTSGYGYAFSTVSYGKPVAFGLARLWFSDKDKVFRYNTSFPAYDADGVTLATREDVTQIANIVGERFEGETDDTARIQRALDISVGGTCKIPSGTYYINPLGKDNEHMGLQIPSNITIEMEHDTILKCLPQSTNQFCMMTLYEVENVVIKNGNIIGERDEHVGTTGEHGMGINILNSTNIVIDNVKLKDHWGDCIYVGGISPITGATVPSNITIRNCICDNSRRQGISVTICDGVLIDDCRITNINGTAPQYGIDIETNDPNIPCQNVVVRDCYFSGSVVGGFVIGNSAKNITAHNCVFDGDDLNITKCDTAIVTNNKFEGAGTSCRGSHNIIISNNSYTDAGISVTSSNDVLDGLKICNNSFICKEKQDNDMCKGVSFTGTTNDIYNVSIIGNTFANFHTESIYCYAYTHNLSILDNVFYTDNITRYMCQIRGINLIMKNNIFKCYAESEITTNNCIIQCSITNSTISNNTFDFNNVRWSEGVLNVSDTVLYTEGMCGGHILGNNIISNLQLSAIKFASTMKGKCYVTNNDFIYRNKTGAFINDSNHFFKNNIYNDSVSGD